MSSNIIKPQKGIFYLKNTVPFIIIHQRVRNHKKKNSEGAILIAEKKVI